MIERNGACLVERFLEEFDSEHAAWFEEVIRITDEAAEQLEAIRSPIERQPRLTIVHFSIERVNTFEGI